MPIAPEINNTIASEPSLARVSACTDVLSRSDSPLPLCCATSVTTWVVKPMLPNSTTIPNNEKK